MTSDTDQNEHAFVVTHRMVLHIAIPMTLGLITVPIVGIVDLAVIGQLGDAALMGGIAVGALLFSLVASCGSFLRMGTTGLTAQAVGAKDEISQRAVAYRALTLALIIGAIVVVISPLFVPWSLVAMGGSEEVNAAAATYLSIRLYGMPYSLINFAIFGWLFGIGRSRSGMALMVLQNSVNIVLTIWFVLGLDMGGAGAALGSVAGEVVTVIGGLFIMSRILQADWRVPRDRLFNREAFARFLALNGDILIRTLVMMVAFSMFTSLSARQSDSTLAANELLMNFFMFGAFFLDGIATAAEQLGGRAIGARYRPAFDQATRLSLLWGLGLGIGLALFMWLLGPYLIDALTTSEAVRTVARDYLIFAALTPLIATFAFQLDGIFIGATWSSSMRNVSVLSTLVFIVVQFVSIPYLGNSGLWLAMLSFLAARGLFLGMMLPGRRAKAFA